jgi:DNA-binding CsgD family transcriptional regulator
MPTTLQSLDTPHASTSAWRDFGHETANRSPANPHDALMICARLQSTAAEQIDTSLRSLLEGLMAMSSALGARWRLLDHTALKARVEGTLVAEMAVGDMLLSPDAYLPERQIMRLSKTVRQGRVMQFELLLPAIERPHLPVPLDTLRLTLDALARWLHWLDMSHGPVTKQGPMPPHQRKVLLLMVTGLSEKQIAAELNITTNTAHQYVTALFRRYGVRNRPSLMARWLGQVTMPEDLVPSQAWRLHTEH